MLQDELCVRAGAIMYDAEHREGLDEYVDSDTFMETLLEAAVHRTEAALSPDTGSSTATSAWRVLGVITTMRPERFAEAAQNALDYVRGLPGASSLTGDPAAPEVVGGAVWTRDVYSLRFGVIAPFTVSSGLVRWYLWDVDACGHGPVTVFARYFDTREDAEAEWRSGAGEFAAAESRFVPVDDTILLRQLLPQYEGFIRAGDEDAAQMAEYHRGQRLAEDLLASLPTNRDTTAPPVPESDDITTEFVQWLTTRGIEPEVQDSLQELAAELADSWAFDGPDELRWRISPHRLGTIAPNIRDYYQDDFADDLITLLPHWTDWLGERSGTPRDLVERCLPYANGKPHADIAREGNRVDNRARIAE